MHYFISDISLKTRSIFRVVKDTKNSSKNATAYKFQRNV